jgi:hypothetical protein
VPSDEDIVRNAARDALRLMKDAGFNIFGKIDVAIDANLPFMGYSTQRAGKNIVVVAGEAVKSGIIVGLLIHEMSHIYRTEQNHPSHNHKLLDAIGIHLIHENQLTRDYQVKTIQQAVNHIQDLYADDVSFIVFRKGKVLLPDQTFNFFLDWINDQPIELKDAKKAKWLNVGIMLNNCFALSNLARHNVTDIRDQAAKRAEQFLSRFDDHMKKEFAYIRHFMTYMKENITEEEFERDLAQYLITVIKLAK